MGETTEEHSKSRPPQNNTRGNASVFYYKIRFREKGREFSAQSRIEGLKPGGIVMSGTDHGLEPAEIVSRAPKPPERIGKQDSTYVLIRRANRDEIEKRQRLTELERESLVVCQRIVTRLKLPMHLVRVERFFNGTKIIIYFTADKRVDFRELVKLLVQEFRTRVEMRQIGVRHETQMIGGLGPCGRELCCTSYLKRFESVSIKMAKAQDLPLNPAKISGLCNRLLCCLTYEVKSYRRIKKDMPRIGSTLYHDKKKLRVVRLMTLKQSVLTMTEDREEIVLGPDEWRAAQKAGKKTGKKRKKQS